MKVQISVTLDEVLLSEIEKKHGPKKRSTFTEDAIKKGMLEFYGRRRS